MAKKHKTVKELNLEVENLSERLRKLEENEKRADHTDQTDTKIEDIENILRSYDKKIENLNKILTDFASKKDAEKLNDQVIYKCKECGRKFDNKNDFSEHIKKTHPKMYNCKMCEENFNESWRLEVHMKSHKEISPLKCNICEKDFYVKWRMEKHRASHSEQTKFCHYYNNGKNCPYEAVGCRFKHEVSDQCRFDNKCRFKLCQYKHTKDIPNVCENGDKDINSADKSNNLDKYEKMSEYDQFEVYQEICLNICWGGDHKCMDHNVDNNLLGVDVEKVRDDYNNGRKEMYYCESCAYESSTIENVKHHFVTNHRENYGFKCWACDMKVKTILDYKRHYANKHYSPEEQIEN